MSGIYFMSRAGYIPGDHFLDNFVVMTLEFRSLYT